MDGDRGSEIEMIVESVRVHMPTGRHVLVLREVDSTRLLMVWVGPWEASAIAMKLQGLTPERPLTHDLFATVLTTLGVTVERIVITDLADETYHARLELNRGGDRHEIDARPSDAIALAVRMGVPVFASSDVLDRAATVPDDDDDEEDEGEEAGATARGAARRSTRRPPARSSTRPASRSSASSSTRSTRTASSGAAAPQLARGCRPGSAQDRTAPAARALAVGPHPQAQAPEVLHRAPDDRRLGAGGRARRPRVVRDADLDHAPARGLDLDQQLGREERAARLDADALERLPPEQLAGAVDVLDLEAEEDAVGELVGPRVDDADDRVRALDPVADDRVRMVRLVEARRQPAEVRDLELAVAVGEREQVVARRLEARAQGAAVAAVDRVVDDADDVRVLGREPVRDLGRPVLRPVVDGDDLELLGDPRQGLERLVRPGPRGSPPRCGPGRSTRAAARGRRRARPCSAGAGAAVMWSPCGRRPGTGCPGSRPAR